MNTRTLLLIVLIILVSLSACAPAATPAPIAAAPRESYQAPAPTRNSDRNAPIPTAAAEAPMAPAYEEASPASTLAVPAPNSTGDNYFQDYGVNAPVKTAKDHLSTFALDVDTASYTLTRRYVSEGSLPPIDAVRAEEFINAFDQGYVAPKDAAFTIYADGAPSPFARPGSTVLRFGVQGNRVSNRQRKALHLTFVIDTSGSMFNENRLGLVKDSLHLLVDRLDTRDTVSVISYSTNARVVLNPTNGSDHDTINRAIDRLQPNGSTNAEGGLRLGYQVASEMLDNEATNRVILCSDGVANAGNTDASSILDYVGGFVNQGITLTTIGVGMGNFNDVLLEQLADRGNGSYNYVDTLEQARVIFVDHLTSTLQVIAYDAKVQVDFNPDVVASYRQIGYENRAVADQDFRNNQVDAGEIGAGLSATALYEVQIKPGAEGRIATVQLRWQDADTREIREINGNFNTFDLVERFDQASPNFQLTTAVAAYAEVLRASPYVETNLTEIANQARRIAFLLFENDQAAEFADLAAQSVQLSKIGE